MIPLVTTKVPPVFSIFKMFVNIIKVRFLYILEEFFFSTFQIMVNVMHARPRYDFSADYFVKIYRAECVNLRLHCNLIKSILDKQVCTDAMCKLWNGESKALSSVLSVTRIARITRIVTNDTTVERIHVWRSRGQYQDYIKIKMNLRINSYYVNCFTLNCRTDWFLSFIS